MLESDPHRRTSRPANVSPAILFDPEGYESGRQDVMGRLAANQSFLKGLIRYGGFETLYCCTEAAQHAEAFEQLARDLGAAMPIRNIDAHRLDRLTELGSLIV